MNLTIIFKEMKLSEDGSTVFITGECLGKKVEMDMSILQLAKIFGTDKKVEKELQKEGFGSEGMELRCDETRKLVKEFPDIKVSNNEIDFGRMYDEFSPGKVEKKEKTIELFAEDLCGWSNEGIRIKFPREIYNSKMYKIRLGGNNIIVTAKPLSVSFKEEL